MLHGQLEIVKALGTADERRLDARGSGQFLLDKLAKFSGPGSKQDDDITLVSLQYSMRAQSGGGG